MSEQKNDRKVFTAVIERHDDGIDSAFVAIPFNVEKIYGTKGQVKVNAWFDGQAYRGVLANMGKGYHIIGVRKDIRKAIEKNIGDKIKVELERDIEERVVEVPEELKRELRLNVKASEFFDSLSFTNRKEYALWISSAKKEETRLKRLQETIQKLIKGLKNPSAK